MDESFLLKLALIISIVGLVILFFLSNNIKVNDTTIDKLTGKDNTIKITGTVKEISKRSGLTVLVISQETEIDAVAFSSDLDIKEGDKVEIIGKVSDKDMIIDSITLVE